MTTSPRARSSPSSTATSSARTTPSAPSPSRCATAGAASSSTGELREEVLPKNILMIGPTGVGKTEIAPAAGQARRRAVPQGRGDQVHRGRLCRPRRRADRPRPGRGRRSGWCATRSAAGGRRPRPSSPPRSACSTRWSARRASPATRDSFRKQAARRRARRQGDRDRGRATPAGGMPFEIPGMPARQIGMINLGDMLGKAFGSSRTKTRKHRRSRRPTSMLIDEEADKLLDQDEVVPRGARRRPRTTASSSSTRSTRSRRATAAAAPTSAARACSATCCR